MNRTIVRSRVERALQRRTVTFLALSALVVASAIVKTI
jgi:hypothetical protein